MNPKTKRKWAVSAEDGAVKNGHNKEIHLEPRLMTLFHILFENADKIVSRKELVSRMWPDTIVNEGSLARAISDLRKILNTEFENPPLIETMHKRGYRMTFPTEKNTTPLWRQAAVYAVYFVSGFILLILVIRGLNY